MTGYNHVTDDPAVRLGAAFDPRNANHYSYQVRWSDEDGEYVGTCPRFPTLSWLSPNEDEAMSGIVNLVQEVLTGD